MFTFGADGIFSGATPDGLEIRESHTVEGDRATFTAAEDHPARPGAVGVYTFEIADGRLTFTVVTDGCAPRAEGMTAAPWRKVE